MQLFDQRFVFSNQPRHRLARHGLFWLVVMLYFGFLYGVFPLRHLLAKGIEPLPALLFSYTWSAIEAFIYMPNHMVLTYGILYLLIPRLLNKGHYISLFMGVLALGALAALISVLLATRVIVPLRQLIGLPSAEYLFTIGYAFMAGLRGATTVAGFAAAIKLCKDWYLKQQALNQIQQEKFQAELQLLKSQIHPHFLFNTLNNLYALTLRKSDQSPAVVLRLSELLSYMLYDCNADEVPLEKEIAFIRNYVGLEQLRYGDRLDLSMSFHGDLQGKQIAPLLLIPFLENAFKHGTSEQLDQAWISLDLAVEGDTLRFKLINSHDSESGHAERIGGIGLQNVRKRLELLYPKRYDLQVMPEEDLFLVSLTLRLDAIVQAPTEAVPDKLPAPVNQILQEYVAQLHTVQPGLVEGVYLTGSVPMGDYYSRKSDIDFITLLKERPNEEAVKQLARLHHAIERRYNRPKLNGFYLTQEAFTSDRQLFPCFFENKMHANMPFNLDKVTVWELKTIAYTVDGIPAGNLPIATDIDEVQAQLHQNINTYWTSWIAERSRMSVNRLLLVLFPRLTEWGVLGVARQLYTLETGQITSKLEAGRYCLSKLPPALSDVMLAALETRQINRTQLRPSTERANQTLACMQFIIAAFNKRYEQQKQAFSQAREV